MRVSAAEVGRDSGPYAASGRLVSVWAALWDDVERFDVEPARVGRRVCTRLESLRLVKSTTPPLTMAESTLRLNQSRDAIVSSLPGDLHAHRICCTRPPLAAAAESRPVRHTGCCLAQSVNVGGRVTAEGSTAPLSEARVFLVGTSVSAQNKQREDDTPYAVFHRGPSKSASFASGISEQKKQRRVGRGGAPNWTSRSRRSVVKLTEIVTTATGEQRRVELGQLRATSATSPSVEQRR